jgi:hypothetical protein
MLAPAPGADRSGRTTGPRVFLRPRSGKDSRMVTTKIGYGLSGLLGAGIIFIGARFLIAPQVAAAGYGIASEPRRRATDPYLAVKGVRDIASGVVLLDLLAARRPRIVAGYLAAASMIPIGDAIIVLRNNGPKATAYGVHGATAAAMLAASALLFAGHTADPGSGCLCRSVGVVPGAAHAWPGLRARLTRQATARRPGSACGR